MARKAGEEDRNIKYLVLSSDGEFIIEIPSTFRLTFGYVNPAKSAEGYARNESHCLRVWEGEKLRAVYGNVRGFRDMAIPLARKVQKETGSSAWTMDSEGNFESQKKVTVESELVLEAAELEDVPF